MTQRTELIDETGQQEQHIRPWIDPTKLLLVDTKSESTKGLRYNEGKLRYDLFEPFAMEQLAHVFTKGAQKYAPRNWEKGMNWSDVIASLKRHVAYLEACEDFDKESGLLHAAHAAWNALALTSYYKIAPQYDDRAHSYLKPKRIGLDVDECIADFTKAYGERTGADTRPTDWYYCYDIVNNFETWRNDGTLIPFYEAIQPLVDGAKLPFTPVAYITNRPVDTPVTEAWLKKYQFPLKPVFTTRDREDKVKKALELKLDYFIDDNFDTFVEMNKAGICCFLMNASHNQKYEVGYKRIFSFEDFKTRFL